jgi:type IV pilus assembly protein PilB
VPQDGRTHFNGLDLRISVIPTFHGEKAVIRLLDTSQAQLSLAGVGMQPDDLSLYKRMISNRSGIILITGPTGCGKTTTLYATLSHLHSKEINIITIEDPIEYQLAGINQIQVNKKAGLTFSHGLRSILRQDPDIIMVGEIRDLETAKIAFQSALTGHLVLSTLHTNDAASALPRLIDIGIEKYFVDACLIGVVSQRLVRKLSKDGGYKGRTGIFEILHNGKTIRSMVDDGLAKIKQGITSKQELSRVLYLD